MFEIFLDIPAQDFIKKADKIVRLRVKETLEELALDPVPHGAKRIIESKEKIFRLRSRYLRLLYRIEYDNQTIVIIAIEPLSRMHR
jgi:mRNA-degrading endonuclease RelE of RelBE toxin-antitoxin system